MYLMKHMLEVISVFLCLLVNDEKHIADRIGVNVSQVYGVVTFYSFFTMQPKGENVISICLGTACFVKGSGKLLEACENYLGIPFHKVIRTYRIVISFEILVKDSNNFTPSTCCEYKEENVISI